MIFLQSRGSSKSNNSLTKNFPELMVRQNGGKIMGYSIGQVAKKTGLTAHTLRYYEKEGLLPFVKKSGSGLRVFTDVDLDWLSMIECLKETGMPLKGIKQYIDWFLEGDSTLEKRLEMFKQHQKNLETEMQKLKKHMARISYKIKLYEKAVETGSLEKAQTDAEIIKERQKIFPEK